MKRLLISAAVVGTMLTFYNCKDTPTSQEKSLTKKVVFNKEGELTLMKAANDSIIGTLDIEIADDEYSTQTGLMYRSAMAENQAMLFVFNNMQQRSFYMKNTQIPLDIIYLNDEKEIVSIQKNAKPFDETSLTSEAASQYVLEVNAGLSDKWNIEKGDKISFTKSN